MYLIMAVIDKPGFYLEIKPTLSKTDYIKWVCFHLLLMNHYQKIKKIYIQILSRIFKYSFFNYITCVWNLFCSWIAYFFKDVIEQEFIKGCIIKAKRISLKYLINYNDETEFGHSKWKSRKKNLFFVWLFSGSERYCSV